MLGFVGHAAGSGSRRDPLRARPGGAWHRAARHGGRDGGGRPEPGARPARRAGDGIRRPPGLGGRDGRALRHGGARPRPPPSRRARRVPRRPSGGPPPRGVPPRARGAPRPHRGAGRAGGGAPRGAASRSRASRPTHLVAVERPGRALDGGYYNARGRSIAASTRRSTRSSSAGGPGSVTIGVGDGGNEIGMGRVRARVVRDVPNGAKIASVVRTDHLDRRRDVELGGLGRDGAPRARDRPRLLHTPDGRGPADARDGPGGRRGRAHGDRAALGRQPAAGLAPGVARDAAEDWSDT